MIHDILDNYVPKDIFNKEEIITYKKPIPDTSFLYLRTIKNKEEVLNKIESEFDKDGKLIRYHLKNYGYELEENKLNQEEALKLAIEFVNRYVDEIIEVTKVPDLYPSLYEKDKHESYGDNNGNCIVVVDFEHGFVEYFIYN